MQIKTQRKGPVLIAKVTGELDHHSAKQFVKEMDKQLSDETVRELQLDFKGLTFMDSSGIGALLGRYKKLAGKKGLLSSLRNYLTFSKSSSEPSYREPSTGGFSCIL